MVLHAGFDTLRQPLSRPSRTGPSARTRRRSRPVPAFRWLSRHRALDLAIQEGRLCADSRPMPTVLNPELSLLVLDVQSVWLRAVERIADDAGFATTTTSSEGEALRFLERGEFDVVMLAAEPVG